MSHLKEREISVHVHDNLHTLMKLSPHQKDSLSGSCGPSSQWCIHPNSDILRMSTLQLTHMHFSYMWRWRDTNLHQIWEPWNWLFQMFLNILLKTSVKMYIVKMLSLFYWTTVSHEPFPGHHDWFQVWRIVLNPFNIKFNTSKCILSIVLLVSFNVLLPLFSLLCF